MTADKPFRRSFAEQRERRKARAAARQAARDGRTVYEQLRQIADRPGVSARETVRLGGDAA
jgi:hypothetical protein